MEDENKFEQRQEIVDIVLNELKDKCAQLCSHSNESEKDEEDEENRDEVVLVKETPLLHKARSVDMFSKPKINKKTSFSLGVRKISQATVFNNHRTIEKLQAPSGSCPNVKKSTLAKSVSTNLTSTLKSTASLSRD